MGHVDQQLDGRPFGAQGEGVGLEFERLSDREIGEALDALARDIAEHPVYQNAYFERLRSGEPFSPETFAVHRINFLARTRHTRQIIATGCARSAGEGDSLTFTLLSHILDDEGGKGNPEHCHERLMVVSHNRFGEAEFGLPPSTMEGLNSSPHFIDASDQYRQVAEGLMSSGDYRVLLGGLLAVESHADPMLEACRMAFRRSRDRLEPDTYRSEVEHYFTIHIGEEDGPKGVEDRHAIDAMRCVRANVRSVGDLELVRQGALSTLDLQQAFWHELELAVSGQGAAA